MNTRGTRRRGQWQYSLLLLLWASVSLGAAGEYRTVDVESLKIEIDSEWAVRTTPGYLPVRFDITNLGEARVIEIVAHGQRFFRSARTMQGGIEVRQAVRMARGDRVKLTIPVPVVADSESIRFEILEDGRVLERFNYTGFTSGSMPGDASALIVADRATPFGTMAAAWLRPMGPPSSGFYASGTVLAGPTAGPTGRLTLRCTAVQRRRSTSCSIPDVSRPTGSGTRRFVRS